MQRKNKDGGNDAGPAHDAFPSTENTTQSPTCVHPSEINNIRLKADNSTSKNDHISNKTESVAEECPMDTQKTSKKSEIFDDVPNASSSLDSHDKIVLRNVEGLGDSVEIQNNKRKENFDIAESLGNKKPKLDAENKTGILFKALSAPISKSDEAYPYGRRKSADGVAQSFSEIKLEKNDDETDVLQSGNMDRANSSDKKEEEPKGSVLHCLLQFINGKNKVYVKMNCPSTADRNTMYQVFQLLKNKVTCF